ncbi:hypothetical protein QFZ30_002254 [Arthrobacter pascens]|uniref:hypothetical protein n=1 Tax=Arthrobacter pascens TaxID=1677 RepID=UPI0027941E8D|nr:hypothetical protein [Arthrobacter pascens]MDQ0678872.1 hypothetical protein [Arthrobacter pascens]
MFGRQPLQDSKLEILLSDLKSRQEEIHHRLNQESSSYLALFAVFVGTVGALAAASTWASSVPLELQAYLPAVCLLFALTLLWLPVNEAHQQLNIRLLAVYISERLVPEIRQHSAIAEKKAGRVPPKEGSPLLSWESYRNERFLSVKLSNVPLLIAVICRSAVPYGPFLAAFAYYSTIPTRLTEGSGFLLEVVLLLLIGAALVTTLGIILMLAFDRRFQVRPD